MYARDLARSYPTVSADDDALDAVRLVTRGQLPALLVLDPDQYPYAIVSATRLVTALVPDSVQDDPLLASVIDDRFDDDVRASMVGRSVIEWLPRRTITAAVVGPDASAMQIAALMARKDTSVVAVVEHSGDKAALIGAITAARLLEHFTGGS